MKSILGIGNALTDILAVLPDDALLKKYANLRELERQYRRIFVTFLSIAVQS